MVDIINTAILFSDGKIHQQPESFGIIVTPEIDQALPPHPLLQELKTFAEMGYQKRRTQQITASKHYLLT
ncbi:hypothetical protein SAMN02745127_00832 [Oceanospirillum multiglobuliferum]|uniref:Uncharacterized protein n=1 Tax=Oceanospirillum multiglobuliferum TaxID=64969 RepID=A0A1T4MLW8_9GAMM|nr:hypothetical protein BTE48_00620 [Oceanospirillum multiglobuliferum]SJZ67774.1 hypothetical protein SAMN02745127_00832 [Oceanospirillum multiglobuliferum]